MGVRRVILLLLIIVVISLTSAGCKSPEKHLKAFHKKGGKIECKGDTVYIEKVIKGKDGKDSIIYVPTKEYIPQIEYRTKWQVRFDNKRFKDSLNAINKANKLDFRALKERNDYSLDSFNKVRQIEFKHLETELKKAKHESKSSIFWTWIGKRWYLWCIISFFIGIYTLYRVNRIRKILRDE